MGTDRERRRGRGRGGLTERLSLDVPGGEAAALEAAGAALGRGELVIVPTDTLYALACRALDESAARRLRAAKGRDDGKPLPLVAADLAQVEAVIGPLGPASVRLADAYWPGPLSLVLDAPRLAEAITSGTGSAAVRVPAHGFLRLLCRRAGPLVSTSANQSGRPAPRTCGEALAAVGAAAVVAVEGGPGRDAPSTIVDARGDPPRLIREGAIPWEAVLRALWPRIQSKT